MKYLLILAVVFGLACDSGKKENLNSTAQDEALIKNEVTNFHRTLKRIYNGAPLNSDSLINYYFDKDMYYVTYWGISEPIDTTKRRLQSAIKRIKNYDNQFDNLSVKVYTEGAYAFFILRQDYTIDGHLLEEYLPTTWILEPREGRWKVVHAQRSADLQTTQQLMQIARLREQEAEQRK